MRKRILLLFLVCSMLLVPLFGCNKKEEATGTSGGQTNNGSPYDADGYLKDDLPDDLNFGNVDIEVLHWSDSDIGEFNPDKDTTYTIEREIYMRDRTVENRLGVSFRWIGMKGSYDHRENFMSTVQQALDGGDRYDIIAAYSQTAGMLATNGLVATLQDNRYLDLSKPWWPESLTSSFTISDDLYFVSGDLSSTFLSQMISVYYNKSYFLEQNLYDLVYDGEWTMDKMIELSKSQYVDLDQDYTKSQLDRFGVVVPWYVYLDGFFYGCDLITVDRDSEGELRVSSSYIGEQADNLTEMLQNLFCESNDGYHTQTVSTVDIFARGDAAFMVAPGVQVLTHAALKDTKVDYGILPMPKYDTQQDKYKTVTTNLISLYSIFVGSTQEEIERAGAVLECLGSESHRGLAPVLFNECLQLRYAKDGDTGKMYDIIREGVVFDVGRVYAISLDSITQNDWQKTVIFNDGVWGAKAGGIDARLQGLLDKLQDSFSK